MDQLEFLLADLSFTCLLYFSNHT